MGRTSSRSTALAATVAGAIASAAVAPASVIPSQETGISGTTNWFGDILSESNSKLIHQLAYGVPGSRTWGEWEKLARTDEAVSKSTDFVLAPIRDARVDVKAGDESDLAQKQADFVRWALLENMGASWSDFVQQSVGGSLKYGFALHEKVPSVVEHPNLPGGVGYGIAKLAERLPLSVWPMGWIQGADGELETIRQQGWKGGTFRTDIMLPASKVLLNTWNRSGDNYQGFSAFRAVWYIAKIREQLLKLTGVSMMREGAGIPIAYAVDKEAQLTDSQRKSFIKLLANAVFHENAAIIAPPGWKVEWIYSPGANKGHVIEVYNQLGLLIMQQVGAQQLHLGTGSTGSRSVGEVHSAEADVYRLGAISGLEAMVNGVRGRPYTGLVRDLIDFNWGPQPVYPKVILTLKKSKMDPKVRLEALTLAKAAGVFTGGRLDDENNIREELGFSPIEQEEFDAIKAERDAKVAALPILPPGQAPQPGHPPKTEKLSAGAPFTPRRPLRPSEQNLDLAAISNTLDTSRDSFADTMRPLAVAALIKAMPQLKAAMATGDASTVGDIQLDMTAIDAALGKYLEGLRAEGYRQVKGELSRQHPKSVHLAAGEEDDKYTGEGEAAADAQSVLEPMRKHLVRKMQNRLTSDLEKEAIDADRTGGSAEDAISRTMEFQTTSGAFTKDAGLVTAKAFSVGRDEFAQERGADIESCELSAVLDANTCSPCDQLDGTEFEFGSAEDDDLTPPLSSRCDGGDNCRCLKLFNFKKPSDDGEGDA